MPPTVKALYGAVPAQLTNAAGSANAVITVPAGSGLLNQDIIRITLTNGLKFDGTPLPTLTVVPAVVNPPALLSGGNAGDTEAVFRVDSPIPAASTITLNVSAAMFDLRSIPRGGNADIILNMTTQMGVQIGNKDDSLANAVSPAVYPFASRDAMAVLVTGQKDTADVAAGSGPYTKFVGNLTAGTPIPITITHQGAVGGTDYPNLPFAVNKVLITVEGDFTGIATLGATAGFVTGSTETGDITTGVANQFKIIGNKAYAVNTLAWAVGGAQAFALTFNLNGTTQQVARTFTIKVEELGEAGNWLPTSFYGPTQNYEIVRNGVSFRANSTGPYNTIKITDTYGSLGANGGVVHITGYDAAGNLMQELAGLPPIILHSNETITLSGADIAARFGGVYPVRLDFAVETVRALVSNVKKSPDGLNNVVYNSNFGEGGL